jgi:hypothetical protein
MPGVRQSVGARYRRVEIVDRPRLCQRTCPADAPEGEGGRLNILQTVVSTEPLSHTQLRAILSR